MRIVFGAVLGLFGLVGCNCDEGLGPFPRADGGIVVYDEVPTVVALAGADLRVLEGSRVQLDGNASRSLLDGEPVSLTWSQVEGPTIGLTNPSSPSPAFVAPLSPATLRFRLRAEAGGQVSFDEMSVVVADTSGSVALFVEPGRDAVASPGDEVRFVPDVVGTPAGEVELTAEARCLGAPPVTVEDGAVSLTLPEALPCLVFVDATDAQGTSAGTAARVYWPEGTPLPAVTRLRAPVVSDPTDVVTLVFEGAGTDPEATTAAWPAGGRDDGLDVRKAGPVITFDAPRKRTRLVIGGERRLGAVSGGLSYALIDVSAGLGNRAPIASGGADRRVRPGASFTLDTSASFDLDEDDVTIEVVQVLGGPAGADELQPGVFHAPEDPEELLFHVIAFDGIVYSLPDSVRVAIDPTIENEAPVIEVEPVRYVAPGRTFTLDASDAYDPDSGFIDRFQISQSPEDPTVLLPEPVDAATVELVAGADGDVYHFRLSAFDEAGRAGSADVEVVVEEAGPYVDATLGDDEAGNGTAEAPFASLGAAVEVAARHRLPELRLGAGPQLPFAGTLDGSLTVRGGFEWDGVEWLGGGATTELPVPAGDLVVADATLTDLSVELRGADARLRLAGHSALARVDVSEGPVHQGTMLVVDNGATAALDGVSIAASAAADGDNALVDARDGAALRMTDTVLGGGAGGDRVGVRCEDAFIDTVRTQISAASGGQTAIGIEALACDIQLLMSDVTGGTATQSATAIHAVDTVLFVGPGTRLTGALLGSTQEAVGVRTEGDDTPVAIAGTIAATGPGAGAERAVGVDAGSDRVVVFSATVSARGTTESIGVHGRSDRLQISQGLVRAEAPAGRATALLLGPAVEDVSVSQAQLSAEGERAFGVDADAESGAVAPSFNAVQVEGHGTLEAAALALRGARLATVTDCELLATASGPAGSARALGFADGVVTRATLEASGDGGAFGLVLTAGGGTARLDLSEVRVAAGGSGIGVLAASAVDVDSSFISTSGGADTAAVDARASVELRHATLVSSGTALLASSSSAALDLANTALQAPLGLDLRPGAPMPSLARSIAFASDVALRDGGGAELRTVAELAGVGCFDCSVFTDLGIDDDGRIVPVDNHPLVDQADPTYVTPVDIDGEARPQGALPDIGCDEHAP